MGTQAMKKASIAREEERTGVRAGVGAVAPAVEVFTCRIGTTTATLSKERAAGGTGIFRKPPALCSAGCPF